MSEWWYAILVLAIAAAALLYFARKRKADEARRNRPADLGPTHDYRKARDDAHTSGMSQEDQEWQAASLQRSKEAQERAAKE
jgi:hypothetical protein